MAWTWCLQADFEDDLPPGHGISDYSSLIVRASKEAYSMLRGLVWRFPDVTDTPGTPEPVRNLTRYLAGWIGRSQEGTTDMGQDDGYTNHLYLMAKQIANDLVGDDSQSIIPEERITGETITLGTSPLDSNAYAFDPGGLIAEGTLEVVRIIPDSVQVSGYQYGDDFVVRWSAKDRRYLFISHDTVNVGTGKTVSYSYSYYRGHEVQKESARVQSVRVMRA